MKAAKILIATVGLWAGESEGQVARIVGGGTTTLGAFPYMTALIEMGATPSAPAAAAVKSQDGPTPPPPPDQRCQQLAAAPAAAAA